MISIPILFGILVAGVIAFIALFFRQGSSRVRKRLQGVERKPQDTRPKAVIPSVLPQSLVDKFEGKLGLKKDSSKVKELKKLMVRAGIYSDRAMAVFLGLKLGMPVALPVIVMPLLWNREISKILLACIFYILLILGYFLPSLVLNHLVQRRQGIIRNGLPDALDLLVVCVEAGQGLNAALKRVSDDFMVSNPPLAKELLLLNLEINAGLEREKALRNLAERTAVEELESLCNILIQSDRFGTSVSSALKVQSETLRTTRRQKLEEQAAKTPVKLIFPLILFIFPAILVVILGPAVIRVMETMIKK